MDVRTFFASKQICSSKRNTVAVTVALAAALTAAALWWQLTPEADFIPPTIGAGEAQVYQTLPSLEKYKEAFRQRYRPGQDIRSYLASDARGVDPSIFDIKPHHVVADVGCGTGALVLILLQEKVAFSKLYAVDTLSDPLKYLRFMLEHTALPGREKVHTVRSHSDDVRLPAGSLDRVITINTRLGMRSWEDAPNMKVVRTLRRAMKVGAVLHILEPKMYDWEGKVFPSKWVKEPYLEAGFELVSSKKANLSRDYYHVVFRRTASGEV